MPNYFLALTMEALNRYQHTHAGLAQLPVNVVTSLTTNLKHYRQDIKSWVLPST